MIRTTYRGRAIKVLAAHGKPGHVKTVINGQVISHAWQGDDTQALDWFRQTIDRIEDNGGAGMVAMLLPGQYTEPHWYEPGAIDINPAGHATRPGGICVCSNCVIDDPTGGKARYVPLAPDACQFCHEGPNDHNPRPLSVAGPHRYTAPTAVQQAGRQATLDERATATDYDPDEATCDEIYPEKLRGYLTRPRCMYFADHRDAHNPDLHHDHRGFSWPRKAAR